MDFSVVVKILKFSATVIPGLFVVVLSLLLGKILFDRTHAFDEYEEIEDEQNSAFGIVYSAYFVALTLAVSGALFQSREYSVWAVTGKILAECLTVLVLMRVSLWIIDYLILSKFSINKEITQDRNLGVAFSVAGALVAAGCSINGALSGFSSSFIFTFRDILLFWSVGQLILVVGARLYEQTSRYDVHRIIELDDNTAVGLSFGGFLIGLGIIARASLVGAGSQDLADEMLQTFTIAVVGVGLLIASSVFVNLVFMKRSSLKSEVALDNNLAAGMLAAGGYLSTAILVASCLHR